MKGKVLFIVGNAAAENHDLNAQRGLCDDGIYSHLETLGYQVIKKDLATFCAEDDGIVAELAKEKLEGLRPWKIRKAEKKLKRNLRQEEQDAIQPTAEEVAEIIELISQERMHALLDDKEIVILSSTISEPLQAPIAAAEAIEKAAQNGADGAEHTAVAAAEKLEQAQGVAANAPAVIENQDSSVATLVRKHFRNRLVPIIVLNKNLLAPLDMVGDGDVKPLANPTNQITIVERESDRVGGLEGVQTITGGQLNDAVSGLTRSALKIATFNNDENLAFFFGYRSGAEMKRKKNAPARRIALLFDASALAKATEKGWELFDWAMDFAGKAATINDVFQAEWGEIRERRRRHNFATDDADSPPENLIGLALSGGGIRSATFSLGFLQGLKRHNLLGIFDYISTVSGGGYVGGWWSAWLSRDDNRGRGIFPRDEKIEAKRVSDYLKSKDKLAEGSLNAVKDPIHHLRLFGNYITPRKGLLSADTWQAITMMLRNVFLTWVVLLPILFAFVLLGQFYFILQRNSVDEFLTPFQQKIIEADAKTENKRARLAENYEKNRAEEIQKRRVLLAEITQEEESKKKTVTDLKSLNEITQEAENRRAVIGQESKIRLAEIEKARDKKASVLGENSKKLREEYAKALQNRHFLSAFLLLPIVAWLLVTTVFWMRVHVNSHPIIKLANTIPGIVFWALVVCIICLFSSMNYDNFQSPFALMWQGLQNMALGWIALIVLIWILSSGFLWWRSLPYREDEKFSKFKKEYTRGYMMTGMLIFLMVGAVIACIFWLGLSVERKAIEPKYFWIMSFIMFVSVAIWLYSLPKNESDWESRKRIRGNQIMRVQATLLTCLVAVFMVLALSGYGYEIANFLLRDPKSQKSFTDYIAKAGGWAAIIASIAGSLFTAIKASPTGGEDKAEINGSSGKTKLIFATTPLLVLVSLAVAFAWLARWMLIHFHNSPEEFIVKINKAILISVCLYLFLAIYETKTWEQVLSILWRCFLLLAIAFGFYYWITGGHIRDVSPTISSQANGWLWYCFLFAFCGATCGILIAQRLSKDYKKRLAAALGFSLLYALFFFVIAFKEIFHGSTFFSFLANEKTVPVSLQQSGGILAGIICCGVVMVFEIWKGDKKTKRTVRLALFTYLVLTSFLFFTFFVNYEEHKSVTMGYLTLGLLFLAVSWSVAIGWMTDPNLLSLHTFYKARVVRAYLGASNPNRKLQEISETAGGDDILLKDLQNCQKGAPYHLINSTLNLVGGHDLATAQRSSDYFVFTKLYSGSARTGYRKNLPEQYMQGEMSLGTAVAISGAAVSPNMGAKTQTAAVAMLLTLLNVRLGYWASTPNRNLWRSAQACLWPFYMLKEFSSQTNDLSGYCYLTDGGHFDNTGLYSLVERGCRFIFLSDNGADAKPCFEDLGDAIRRCRIDFQAEINLDVTQFFKEKEASSGDLLAKTHYVVGTIEYAPEHLKQIGWKAEDIKCDEKRQGIIIWIKPALVKGDSPDLRQYARQNKNFPQQSTADLWYNEAQFESYRQIGEFSASKLVEDLGLAETLALNGGNKQTAKTFECAFEIAKQTFDEMMQPEKCKIEASETQKKNFKEKLKKCANPKPEKEEDTVSSFLKGLFGAD